MKKNFYHLTMALTTAAALAACQPQKSAISFEHQGDTLTIVHITNPTKYLILPIQESCNEGKVKLVTGSLPIWPWMSGWLLTVWNIMCLLLCLRVPRKQH